MKLHGCMGWPAYQAQATSGNPQLQSRAPIAGGTLPMNERPSQIPECTRQNCEERLVHYKACVCLTSGVGCSIDRQENCTNVRQLSPYSACPPEEETALLNRNRGRTD